MTKHLVDIDDVVLRSTSRTRGSDSEGDGQRGAALRLAAASRDERVVDSLDTLAAAELTDPDVAWR